MKEVTRHYTALYSQIPLKPIRNAKEHEHAVAALNRLMDAGVADEAHPLADVLAPLGDLIGDYEQEHLLRAHSTPAAVLHFLMDQHGMSRQICATWVARELVSEILAGKRSLNIRQIRALAQRFAVAPSIFF